MPGASGETGKVLVDPADKKRLYVSDPLSPQTALVKTSTDGGQNWKVIHTDNSFDNEDYGLAYSAQKSFAMDPSNAKRLVLGTNKVFECKDATAVNPVWKAISDVLSPSGDVGSNTLRRWPSHLRLLICSMRQPPTGMCGQPLTTAATGPRTTPDCSGSGVGKVVDIRIDPTNIKRAFRRSPTVEPGKNIWFHDPADGKWKNISGDMPLNLGVASIAVDWRFTPNVIYVGSARGVLSFRRI